jgi:ribonucleotide monophosphatase NagD (HAD superfamily)
MIGNDRSTDIAGAQAAGMATLYMHTALTPSDQAEADLSLHPAVAAQGSRIYEFEGDNWWELASLLLA